VKLSRGLDADSEWLDAQLVALFGIDSLTAAVGGNAPHHGSGCDAALPPDSKRLGPKRLEGAARQQVA
jgi:hypothetical protein